MTGHPEIDAILERAAAYRHEVYARLGQPPMTFLVTEQEYQMLLRVYGHGLTGLRLFGMRVVTPEHMLASLTALERVVESVLGPPPEYAPCATRPPTVNSETSSLEEWEAAVHTMIADAKQRRVSAHGNDFS